MQAKSLITLMLWLVLSGNALRAAAATSLFGGNNRPAVRRFVLSSYDVYAVAIKKEGVAGLRKVASPNLTLRFDGKTYHGKEAFAELEPSLNGLQNEVFYVNVARINLTKSTAVTLTEETTGRKLDAETTVTTKRYWTQIWRKMPHGWTLEESSQRPPQISGPTPIMTYTLGSAPETPLTINIPTLGMDLGTPLTAGPVLELYGPYLNAMTHHDEAAFLSLLTPGFSLTDDGKVLNRQASLKLTGQIHGVLKEFPRYYLTINKLFFQPAKATAVVEERFSGVKKSSDMSGSYYWTQHWVRTGQGWRLDNITRTG